MRGSGGRGVSAIGRRRGVPVLVGVCAEGLVVGPITMSGVSAIMWRQGRAMVHRLCHIVELEKFAVSRGLPSGGVDRSAAERLSVCGVLCCVKLAVLLVVTVL
jgi:hypothetical protein